VESTYNWYWLVDALMEAGYEMHLANTAAIVQYSGLKYADDDSDATWLAKLLRLGLLPEGYIYPREERAVRDLLRRRLALVQQHTGNILAVQNLFSRNRGRSMSANEIRRLTPEAVAERVDDPNLALAIQSTILVMRGQQAAIELLEREAWRQTKETPALRSLLTVNGIGRILGLTIALETGPIERFAHAGNYASYCRCVGSTHVSNGKQKGKGNTKNGNKYLAWAYVEAANFAVRYNLSHKGGRSSAMINASARRPRAWSRSKRSRTSWHAPVTTFCATAARLM
jgi:transposase